MTQDEDNTETNTFVIEFLLANNFDSCVDEVIKKLSFDKEKPSLKLRLALTSLNGIIAGIENAENKEEELNERSGAIIAAFEKIVAFIQQKHEDFDKFFASASFDTEAFAKKLTKWINMFKKAEGFSQKKQALAALMKYLDISLEYIGTPKLPSLQANPSTASSASSSVSTPISDARTVRPLFPVEPCTSTSLRNVLGSVASQDLRISDYIGERSKPLEPEEQSKKRKSNASSSREEEEEEPPKKSSKAKKKDKSKKKKTTEEDVAVEDIVVTVSHPKKSATMSDYFNQPRRLNERQPGAKKVTVRELAETSDESEDEPVVRQVQAKTKKPGRKDSNKGKHIKSHTKVFWTESEVEALKKGIKKFGKDWSSILSFYKEYFNPKRDSMALRDKYRNMVKFGHIQE